MISPEHKKLLQELPSTQFGVALKAHLDEEMKRIKDIHACTSWEETRAHQIADKLVEKLFYFMEKKEEVAPPTKSKYT